MIITDDLDDDDDFPEPPGTALADLDEDDVDLDLLKSTVVDQRIRFLGTCILGSTNPQLSAAQALRRVDQVAALVCGLRAGAGAATTRDDDPEPWMDAHEVAQQLQGQHGHRPQVAPAGNACVPPRFPSGFLSAR